MILRLFDLDVLTSAIKYILTCLCIMPFLGFQCQDNKYTVHRTEQNAVEVNKKAMLTQREVRDAAINY